MKMDCEYPKLERWSPSCTGVIEYYNGTKEWYVNGELHRIGGPACEYVNEINYYFIQGKEVTKEQHDLLYSIMQLKGLL